MAVFWLDALESPKTWDLKRMNAMVADAGLPIARLKAIQVSGTNGKGSTCTFIESILRQSGKKTGLYLSPHVLDVTERISINGTPVSNDTFLELTNWAKSFVESNHASYFEALTLMALKHFLDEQVDVAVLEVGMGGRLDATSIVVPNVSVITNISLEHTEHLGSTVEKIALEKASIIPFGGVVVTAAKDKALRVIDREANAKKARLLVVPSFVVERENPLKIVFSGRPVTFLLQGIFQAQNAALAVAAVRELDPSTSDDAIEKGLSTAFIVGRLQKVNNVLVDGAHNPAGISALVDALLSAYPGKKWNLFFGVLSDKNYPEMVKRICRLPLASVTCVRPQSDRALDAGKLISIFKCNGLSAHVGTIQDVFKKKNVLVCGSFYVAKEALALADSN